MNEIMKVFNNSEFGEIRTVIKDDDICFGGKDIAEALDFKHTVNALKAHVDEEDKLTWRITTSGQARNMTVINESGVYALVFSSKLANAKQFKRWVTSEVLPALRKTGSYSMSIPQTLPEALRAYADEVEQHNKTKALVEAQRPKVLFADAVSTSNTDILVGDLAKLLSQNGYAVGQNRLFEQLRNDGFLISRKGNSYNMPTQRAMEMGLFRIKETAITHSDGRVSLNKTPKVTGKGQQYFINRFIGK